MTDPTPLAVSDVVEALTGAKVALVSRLDHSWGSCNDPEQYPAPTERCFPCSALYAIQDLKDRLGDGERFYLVRDNQAVIDGTNCAVGHVMGVYGNNSSALRADLIPYQWIRKKGTRVAEQLHVLKEGDVPEWMEPFSTNHRAPKKHRANHEGCVEEVLYRVRVDEEDSDGSPDHSPA